MALLRILTLSGPEKFQEKEIGYQNALQHYFFFAAVFFAAGFAAGFATGAADLTALRFATFSDA
jgi:hypothetical protein